MTETKIWYNVAILYDNEPEDMLTYYYTLEEAIEKASERSNCDSRAVFCILEHGLSVVYIFINGHQYAPV